MGPWFGNAPGRACRAADGACTMSFDQTEYCRSGLPGAFLETIEQKKKWLGSRFVCVGYANPVDGYYLVCSRLSRVLLPSPQADARVAQKNVYRNIHCCVCHDMWTTFGCNPHLARYRHRVMSAELFTEAFSPPRHVPTQEPWKSNRNAFTFT